MAPARNKVGKDGRLRAVTALQGPIFAALFAASLALGAPERAQAVDLTCQGRYATILGTPGDDVLAGTPGDDVILGLAGDDDIAGNGGNDVICGGPGDDKIRGAGRMTDSDDDDHEDDNGDDDDDHGFGHHVIDGNDVIDGGPGDDKIKGGPGNDLIAGGPGNDKIKGGHGNDVIDGGRGNDKIKGGPGNDIIDGGLDNDKIAGGKGDDDIDGGLGDDKINGGPDIDRCVNGVPKNCESTGGNSRPVAAAGPDQTVALGQTVMLDGGASSDPDGDLLSFSWSFTALPMGSGALLSDPAAVMPSFVVDAPGSYEVRLVVNDGQRDSAPDTVVVSTLNSPPVADAGPDQAPLVGDTVTLDGSGSSDVDGDPLGFRWSFVALPAGSAAVLSDPSAIMPSFVVDLPGTYDLQLIVNDGLADSTPDLVSIVTANSPPVADAGPDQTVLVTDTVTLDGSASSDVDGDLLSLFWSLVSVPAGSLAVLSDAAAVMPTFVADLPGVYVAQLIVNDGTVDSAPATVTISTANSPPVADAGPDQTVLVTDTVTLDGSASSDVDGDLLSFFWSLVSVPAGSLAVLSDAAAVMPTFVADLPGVYVAQLIVNDGTVDSPPDTVAIDTENSPPVADAGPDQTVFVTDTVTLDGSASSDVDGDLLSFSWSFTALPVGSLTVLDVPTSVTPSFVADLPGTYVAQLIVNDGTVDSDPNTVVVVTQNSPPVANAGPDQRVAFGGTVTLDGSASSDVDGDPLGFLWTLVGTPTGSTASLSGATTATPSFDPNLAGDYVVQLVVNDGVLDSAPDTVTVTVDPLPAIVPFSRTIGAGLQFVSSATLAVSNHGGVTVRVESSNPALALIAPDGTTPGSPFIDVFVADGATAVPYTVQGVAGVVGTVTVTASAPGFTDGTGTINVVQPGLAIFALAGTQSVGTNDVFSVLIGIPNGAGTGLSGFQGVSAAAAPLALTLSSSDGAVGELTARGSTGATVTFDLAAEEFQPSATFVPLAAGTTTLAASIPGFLSTTAASQTVTVTGP